MTDLEKAAQVPLVPLVELLESVPANARLAVDDGPHSTTYHPVGRLCHEAATALRRALEQQPAYRAVKTVHEGKPYYVSEQQPADGPVAFFDPVDRRLRQNPAFQIGVSVTTWNGEIPLYTRPQPAAPDEADELLVNLGLDPQAYRTDGGAINYLKVKAALRHSDEYPQLAPAKRKHITDGTPCWCNPEVNYADPDTGVAVIVHKEPQ